MHLGLAAKALHVGKEVALIGTDGPAQRVVILKCSAEPEGQNRRAGKATGDDARMVSGCELSIGTGEADGILGQVLGDNDGEIGRWKEKGLISEEARDAAQRHGAAMTC
jgi:hypothetical protein